MSRVVGWLALAGVALVSAEAEQHINLESFEEENFVDLTGSEEVLRIAENELAVEPNEEGTSLETDETLAQIVIEETLAEMEDQIAKLEESVVEIMDVELIDESNSETAPEIE